MLIIDRIDNWSVVANVRCIGHLTRGVICYWVFEMVVAKEWKDDSFVLLAGIWDACCCDSEGASARFHNMPRSSILIKKWFCNDELGIPHSSSAVIVTGVDIQVVRKAIIHVLENTDGDFSKVYETWFSKVLGRFAE